MKHLLSAWLCFLLASTSSALAQSKTDEQALGKLPQEFCDAWAKHDGHALAKIMAEDGKLKGTRTPMARPRKPRYGMMTLVAEKKHGNWLVVVGQNTNAAAHVPPELQGITTPIAIPGTATQR